MIAASRITGVALLALLAAGCPEERRTTGARPSSHRDAAPAEAGPDASPADAGAPDRDAGPGDTGPGDAGPRPDGGLDAGAPDAGPRAGLPVLRRPDEAAAERGRRALVEGLGLGRALVPAPALESLWLIWDGVPRSGAAYWTEFRARYGFAARPGAVLPAGVEAVPGGHAFGCLACHAAEVAGVYLEGAPNPELDLEGLYDDLVALSARAPTPIPIPFDLDGFTGARGVHDAFGLGFRLGLSRGPPRPELARDYGYQRPAPWWTIRHKTRVYVDGSGAAGGHRLMMATVLALAPSDVELSALEPRFQDISAHLDRLEAPAWPFATPEPGAVARGEAVFDRDCSGCHGVYHGSEARFPDRVVPAAEIGTDPLRAERFGEAEAAWINASWFGGSPMRATGGYLAPALSGVWATAPYLHDGSVPDLAALLEPGTRPARWRPVGSGRDGYDPARVGRRWAPVEVAPDPTTAEGRRVHDATRPGLAAGGHLYGAALSAEERAELLAYLVTL